MTTTTTPAYQNVHARPRPLFESTNQRPGFLINRFALSLLCIELDRDKIFGVMLLYILLVWRLNDVSLRNVETIEILGNVFNSKGNNTSHVDDMLNKCRQSFYSLNSIGMSYP